MSTSEGLSWQITRFTKSPHGASLLTGTSSTTESIAPINPGINLGKYKHSCQVEDLNPGGQVPPQEINPGINLGKYKHSCQVEDLNQVDRFHHKKPNQFLSLFNFKSMLKNHT
jgi:hypothetical protein